MRILLSVWKNPVLVAGDQVGEATWKLLALLLPREIVKSKAEVSLGCQRCHCYIKVRVTIPKSSCISPMWVLGGKQWIVAKWQLSLNQQVPSCSWCAIYDSLLKQVHTSLVRWHVVAFDVRNCPIPIFKGRQIWFLQEPSQSYHRGVLLRRMIILDAEFH